MFALRGVVKVFGTQVALDVDLELARGRTTVLLGPSGCGKSTLLRLCMGLATPDRGEVRFDGTPLDASARRRIGYVIQEGGLFPHLTAAENVALPHRAATPPHPRSADAARIDELARLVQLERSLLARYPLELSGGQRQRVSLMRALVLDPEALLLDEPFGALDPIIRAELQHDLGRIARTLHKTVVMVTHDLGDAAALADEVILLRSGRVVQRGTLAALVHQPVDPFVTRFIDAQRAPFRALDA
ncbi:MAG: ATP-binding cassette domain-containing protein [Deltaproteobacteria bacterium]|nr:ATP-binding cassette domain-containing protein [Deltaproteobacteria bacterium]